MSDVSGGGMGGQADVLWVDIRAQLNEISWRDMETQAGAAGERAGAAGGAGLTGKFGALLGTLPGMAAAAAVAVGAALVTGLKSAVDIAAQVNQGQLDMQASLGVTADEARSLGEVAKGVFGNNWTGSLAEAQKAVENVRKEVQGLSKEDLQTVTEGSVAIAGRFEEDQSKVAAAVQSVMKATGSSAQEALDFISAGFQKGLNSSGDFLDTLNEYGPQFEKAKTTGSELFSLLETGAAKGALGTDKVADSFKEFGFSLADTSKGMTAAFAQLGIDQGELTKKIDGGSMTQTQAYQLVMDKLKGVHSETERMAIISQIFKGAGEDLGKVAGQIDTTKTKMSELGGSTETVKAASNTLGSVFQTAWRQVQLQLEPVGQELLKLANDAMPTVKSAIGQVGPIVTNVVRFLVDGFRQGRQVAEDMAPGINNALNTVKPVVTALGGLFQSTFVLVRTLWENVLRPAVEAVLPVVQVVFTAVSQHVRTAINVVTNVINAASAMLRGDWSKAWQYLAGAVVGGLDGVERTLKEALPKLGKWGQDLAGKLLAGIKSGLAGLSEMFYSAMAGALNTLGDKMGGLAGQLMKRLAGAAQGAAANAAAAVPVNYGPVTGITSPVSLTPKSSGSVAGLAEIQRLMGLGGDRTGTPFGHTYFGNQVHNGEDIFARTGTDIVAPFTGMISTRWSKTTGHIIELIDAQGQKLLLGHLDHYANGLEEAIQKAGGKLLVKQGQLIGAVGQTGSLAHKDLGSGNAHVHMMAYTPDGKIIDPKSVKFVPIGETAEGRQAVTHAAKLSNQVAKPAPVTAPLKTPVDPKEIQKALDDRVKDVQARLQLKIIGRDEAIKELKVIEDQAISLGKKGGPNLQAYAEGAKAARTAIDGLKKGSAESVDVLGALGRQYEYAGKTGLPAYISGLKAYIAQQEKVVSSTKDGTKAHSDAMDKVIQARQKLAGVQKTEDLGITSKDIATYKARAQEVIGLEKAMATSTDVEWKARAQNRIDAYSKLPAAAQSVLKLLKDQDSQETQLGEKAKAREKEQAQLRAQVADTKRQLTISAAQQALDRVTELDKQELSSFKGTAAQRVELVKRQAQDEYNAKEKLAAATRDKAIRDAQNDTALGASVRDERIRQARATYDQTMLLAKGAQADQLQTAKEGITKEGEAVQGLVDKYRAAREELSKKADAGTLTAGDMDDYAKKLGDLWTEAGKAGVKALPEIQKAHAAAREFADVAIDKNAEAIGKTAGQYGDVADVASRAAASTGVYRASLEDVLALLPDGADQWDAYLTSMTALDKQGVLAAGVLDGIKDHVQGLRDAIAAAEGEAAGAAALQDVLGNPTAYADGGAAGQAQAEMQQRQKDMAESLQQTLLGLDDATIKNSDSMGVYEDMLNNAGKSGAITDKQLKDLLETLNQLKLAGNPTEDFSQYANVTDGARGVKPVQGNDFAQQTAYAAELTTQIREQFKGLQLDTQGLTDATSGWNDMLGNMVKTGAISATQEKALLQVIQDIIKGKKTEADEFKDTAKKAEDAGKLLAQAQDVLAASAGKSKGPNAELIRGLEALRGQAGVSQEALEGLITALKTLDAASEQQQAQDKLVAKINKIADYAQKLVPVVTGAMQALGGATSEEADQWGQDLGSMVSDLTNFGLAIAKGDYLGAAIQGLTSIFNWFGRNKKAAQEAAKATADYNAQFKFSTDGYGTRSVTKTTTGFLFWSTDHYKEQIDTVKRDIALALEGGFENGIKSGFEAALAANDFSLFGKSLKESVGKAVLDGLMTAFMNEAIMKQTIGPAIQQYLQDGNAVTLQNAVGAATAQAETFYNNVLAPVASQFGLLGTDNSTGAGSNNGALFGNAPTAQLGVPTVSLPPEALKPLTDAFATITPIWESVGKKLDAYFGDTKQGAAPTALQITLPDVAVKPLVDFGASVLVFDTASRRMLDAANVILAAHAPSGNPPKLSGNGGLA